MRSSVGFTFIVRMYKKAVVLSQLGLATGSRPDGNVIVRSPCSTSNLGPGYDVFGLALDALHDTVEVSFLEKDEIVVEVQGVYSKDIPVEIELNSAGRTAIEFSRRYGAFGCKIRVEKGIPPGSGLGSSGASAAGTAVALNLLLGLKLEKQELVDIAAQGEIAAAGAAHADNVAPAIYGGFVVIRSYNPLQVLSLTPPKDFDFAIALPLGIKKTTKKARSVVPENVPISSVVQNIGAASCIVAGLLLSDFDLFGKGMLGDVILEPSRAPLYPGYLEAKEAALDCGAVGATLSGAGPAVIALVNRKDTDPSRVAKSMRLVFEERGIACQEYVARPTMGAHTI